MAKSLLKNDRYKKTRGGYSRLLDIRCSKCSTHLFYYQKDGPGILKRTYLDRILDSKSRLTQVNLKKAHPLACPSCKQVIGIPMDYKKEHRLAYRLFVGAVEKKIMNSQRVKI